MFSFQSTCRFLCVGVVFCLPCNCSFGQLELEFSGGGLTGTTFNVPVGSSQTISVTVTEPAPNTTTLSQDGLTAFGFTLTGVGTSADTTSFQGNSAFASVFTNLSLIHI